MKYLARMFDLTCFFMAVYTEATDLSRHTSCGQASPDDDCRECESTPVSLLQTQAWDRRSDDAALVACEPSQLSECQKLCGAANQMQACVLDCCFGQDDHALRADGPS